MVESFLRRDRGSAGFALSSRLKELPLEGRGPACGSLVGDAGAPIGFELLNHDGTTKSCNQHQTSKPDNRALEYV